MVEVNLKNLRYNVNYIRDMGKDLIGVVKNNAYGCGSVEVSKYLVNELNVKYLFVNDFNEAKPLLNLDCNIIIGNSIIDLELIKNYHNITLTINSLDDAIRYKNLSNNVHIQIDTLMNRLGIKSMNEYLEVLEIVKSSSLELIGIYTHFASPESSLMQIEKFKEYVKLYNYKMVHCASTSTFEQIDFGNYFRVGLGLYDIMQVMSVVSSPISIRNVYKGESIGYNSEYVAKEDIKIAILPVGYGNGYRLHMKGFYVYCNGKFYNLLGRICMNHIFIEIDDSITLDSVFELTSPNLKASLLAKHLNSHNYEIYTGFKFNEIRYIK